MWEATCKCKSSKYVLIILFTGTIPRWIHETFYSKYYLLLTSWFFVGYGGLIDDLFIMEPFVGLLFLDWLKYKYMIVRKYFHSLFLFYRLWWSHWWLFVMESIRSTFQINLRSLFESHPYSIHCVLHPNLSNIFFGFLDVPIFHWNCLLYFWNSFCTGSCVWSTLCTFGKTSIGWTSKT